ncbi:MAG: TolC family protein [Alphaproteobacteria bacterium]|nr:TolC family protein [Alphaproteobacteria bacterium]
MAMATLLRHRLLYNMVASSVSIALLTGCLVKPQPLTDQDFQRRADETLARVFSNQEPLSGPITIYEAQARALKYNLDARVRMFDTAVASSDLTTANLSMLPKVLANAGYSERSNEPGSKSQSLITGTTSLDYSKSSERYSYNNSLAMSWDLLDFGIGYLRAKEKADQVLISGERRRAIIQGILRDVRIAYWKAAIAERILPRVERLLKDAEGALNNTAAGQKAGVLTPIESLNYQKNLLSNISELRKLLSSLATAKIELASLINIRPGEDFKIVTDNKQLYMRPDSRFNVKQLETYAVLNRPEIREQDYEQRIRKRQVQQAWLKMIPGVSMNVNYNYDSNQFLFNHNWIDVGFKVVFDVLAPITRMQEAANGKMQMQLVEAKRDALTVAVLAQVNIAYAQQKIALDRISLAEKIARVNDQIYQNTLKQKQAGTAADQKVIDDGANAVFANLQRDYAYAELHHSFGQLLSSVGMDMIPDEIKDESVSTLASAIQTQMNTVSVNTKISTALRTKELPEFAYVNPTSDTHGVKGKQDEIQLASSKEDTQKPEPFTIEKASNEFIMNHYSGAAPSRSMRDNAHYQRQDSGIIHSDETHKKPKEQPALDKKPVQNRLAGLIPVLKPGHRQELFVAKAQKSEKIPEPQPKPQFHTQHEVPAILEKTNVVAQNDIISSRDVPSNNEKPVENPKAHTWAVTAGEFMEASEADFRLYEIQDAVSRYGSKTHVGVYEDKKLFKKSTYRPYIEVSDESTAQKIVALLNRKKIKSSISEARK